MNSFPVEIDIKNKKLNDEFYYKNFHDINYSRILCILRKEIYNLIVSRKDENEYFALDDFSSQFSCGKYLSKLTETIIDELSDIGWKTKLSFGNTGLFIYSTNEQPTSCW